MAEPQSPSTKLFFGGPPPGTLWVGGWRGPLVIVCLTRHPGGEVTEVTQFPQLCLGESTLWACGDFLSLKAQLVLSMQIGP